ncbi:MAG: SprT-like domain-containing protein [candidate division WOR-3 bacterium]
MIEIKIRRSDRRKRTVSARLVGGTMFVNAPADIPEPRLQEIIEQLKRRLEKRKLKRELNQKENLMAIYQKLNAQYFNNAIPVRSIEYSTEQSKKWGVCNIKNRSIRISHRLSAMPEWVRDYVIVHEMAHLVFPNHSEKFWQLVNRYKLAERARGYLIAKGYEDTNESDVED